MGEGPRDHLEYRWSRDYNLGKKWSKDKLECEIIEYYEAEYDEVQEASAIDLALADRLGK